MTTQHVGNGERGNKAWPVRRGLMVGVAVVAIASAGLFGCARTSVENVQRMPAAPMPRPQMIVVHDFAVSADQVALDSALGARLLQMAKGTPESEVQHKVGQEVTRMLTDKLVKEISKFGIPTVSAASATAVAGPSVSIEGHVLTIDEGNRMRRAVIGLGAGASEVRTLVQVYSISNEGRRLVEDFYTTVKSSRKPGMGPMAGVGAAAGRAAESAVISTGVGLATAHSQTVEGDAANAASTIAKELGKLFVQQGWILPDRAR